MGNVYVAALDQLGHLSIKECKQERTNVTSVNVRIGHDNDAMVAKLIGLIFFNANTSAQYSNERNNLLARQHFVKAGFFYVQYFSL